MRAFFVAGNAVALIRRIIDGAYPIFS